MFSLDPRGGHNRYKFKVDFFEKWTSEMAYVLGFIFADGDIQDARKSSRAQYMKISSVDKEILNAIKRALESKHKLNYVPPHSVIYGNGEVYKSTGIYRLRIGSGKMYNDLLKLGLTPKKSLTIKLPKNIPDIYLGDFIRGYFDGDGCVFLEKAEGINKPIIIKKLSVIFTSGSRIFLEGLAEKLRNRLAIKYNKIYNSSRSFQLRYSTADSIKIFELMYENCSKGLYLKRKFDIFREYFKMAPKKNSFKIVGFLNSL